MTPTQLKENCCAAIDKHVKDGGFIIFHSFGDLIDVDGKFALKDLCGCALSILMVGKDVTASNYVVSETYRSLTFNYSESFRVSFQHLEFFISGFDDMDVGLFHCPEDLAFYNAGASVRRYVRMNYPMNM